MSMRAPHRIQIIGPNLVVMQFPSPAIPPRSHPTPQPDLPTSLPCHLTFRSLPPNCLTTQGARGNPSGETDVVLFFIREGSLLPTSTDVYMPVPLAEMRLDIYPRFSLQCRSTKCKCAVMLFGNGVHETNVPTTAAIAHRLRLSPYPRRSRD